MTKSRLLSFTESKSVMICSEYSQTKRPFNDMIKESTLLMYWGLCNEINWEKHSIIPRAKKDEPTRFGVKSTCRFVYYSEV